MAVLPLINPMTNDPLRDRIHAVWRYAKQHPLPEQAPREPALPWRTYHLVKRGECLRCGVEPALKNGTGLCPSCARASGVIE